MRACGMPLSISPLIIKANLSVAQQHPARNAKEREEAAAAAAVRAHLPLCMRANAVALFRASEGGHGARLSALKFSPDGALLATAGEDGSIAVWDAGTHACIARFKEGGHTAGISDIAWAPDSRSLASAGDDKTVCIWSLLLDELGQHKGATGPRAVLGGHSNVVFSLAYSPTGGMLASGSFDESIRLWDVRSETPRCLQVIAAHSDPVTALSFGPDASLLASSSYDGLIRLWDVATGQCVKTIVDDDNPPVAALTFSPNGKYLLAATLDSTIRLWSIESGRCIKSYGGGHLNVKYAIAPSFFASSRLPEVAATALEEADADSTRIRRQAPPDAHIIAGSEDGYVCIYNVNSRAVHLRMGPFGAQDGEEAPLPAPSPIVAVSPHPSRPLFASITNGDAQGGPSIALHAVTFA